MSTPSNSAASTWKKDKTNERWTIDHWLLYLIDGSYIHDKNQPPVHDTKEKVPVLSVWRTGGWAFWRTLVPIGIHYILHQYLDIHLSHVWAFALYQISFIAFAINHLHTLRWLGSQVGYFDGKIPRDEVPDSRVRQVLFSLLFTIFLRTLMLILLAYDPNQIPSINPFLIILQITIYTIVLDFYFYWYHRLMHEVPSLWKFHQTHHQTKHPNAELSLYADFTQEWFDILIVPLFAFFTVKFLIPFDFFSWWLSGAQILYIEAWGHSGVRLYATPANAGLGFLRWFGAELTTEDHDWHHRAGWRKAHNYGKQTGLWDWVFGTRRERLETREENIDWNKHVNYPWL
eukprot:TRINITY_DN22896_c0_g1_i1.p1 TRINITY_DN22896_c0_g1~~TRINITY_DN22896_c0_g1_i1.p1  ORF type:complete len:344 (+),score=39.52 TRINITY_DN22896_c0_g1_i1:69-1100(+)